MSLTFTLQEVATTSREVISNRFVQNVVGGAKVCGGHQTWKQV